MSNWSDKSVTSGLVVSSPTSPLTVEDTAVYWTGSSSTGYIPIQQQAFEAIEVAYQESQNSDYVSQLEERVQCLEDQLEAIIKLLQTK